MPVEQLAVVNFEIQVVSQLTTLWTQYAAVAESGLAVWPFGRLLSPRM